MSSSNNDYLCQDTNRDEIVKKLQINETWRASDASKSRNAIGSSNANPMTQVEIARYLAKNRIKR